MGRRATVSVGSALYVGDATEPYQKLFGSVLPCKA